MNNFVSFDAFRSQWLEDIQAGNPSTIEIGRRFAHKLFTQWRDISDTSPEDLIYCDGPGDGGIDLAYLERGETDNENVGGDTWYLVQSKYGTSFRGEKTLLQEGQKVIDTLDIGRERISEVTAGTLDRVRQFLRNADASGSGDRLL
ncbi:MAG TPA: abortive phage resistance protein, partial [Blastocatellia bacterium]|nr:abortive phage resistance protein [Blastocatellia bacterium]